MRRKFSIVILALLANECVAGGSFHPEHASHAMVVSQNELASQAGV